MSNAFKDWIIANMPPTDDIDNIVFENAELKEENERLKQQLAELPKKICDLIRQESISCIDEDGDEPMVIYEPQLKEIENYYTKNAQKTKGETK